MKIFHIMHGNIMFNTIQSKKLLDQVDLEIYLENKIM